MRSSFLDKYQLAIIHYKQFIKEKHPERLGKDQSPLFPLTLDDLLQYYDYKFQFCTYRTTRNYISLLLHHPKHGPEWKRDIYDNYLVEEKKNKMREAERNGKSNIQNSGVLKPLRRRSRFFAYVPPQVAATRVPEKEHVCDNNSEFHVIQGASKGYVISTTTSKKQLLPTPSLSPPSQQEYQPIKKRKNTLNYNLLIEETLKKDKRRKIEKLKAEKQSIPNKMNTIKLNVRQLANQVHIISYATPISHTSRMLRQTD